MERVRVFLKLDLAWSTAELSRLLAAVDDLSVRLPAASLIAETCGQYDSVLSHMGPLGYFSRMKREGWQEQPTPIDYPYREGYVAFTRALRSLGVRTDIADDGARFTFEGSDFTAPMHAGARLEIEAICMASPGFASLTTSPSPLAKLSLFDALSRLFSSLRFWKQTRALKDAEVRGANADALRREARALSEYVTSREKLDKYLDRRSRKTAPASTAMADLDLPVLRLAELLRVAGFAPDSLDTHLIAPVRTHTATVRQFVETGQLTDLELIKCDPGAEKAAGRSRPSRSPAKSRRKKGG